MPIAGPETFLESTKQCLDIPSHREGEENALNRLKSNFPEYLAERRTKLSIEFVIPGEPKGKGRARSRIAKDRGGKQCVMHYTPKETVAYETLVKLAAHEAMAGDPPTSYPCRVKIIAYCSIPPSWSHKKLERALAGEVFPTVKPDVDNIVKAVLDGMNKIVYRDDSVVCDVSNAKRYSSSPRVEVYVRELDGEPAWGRCSSAF